MDVSSIESELEVVIVNYLKEHEDEQVTVKTRHIRRHSYNYDEDTGTHNYTKAEESIIEDRQDGLVVAKNQKCDDVYQVLREYQKKTQSFHIIFSIHCLGIRKPRRDLLNANHFSAFNSVRTTKFADAH
jgi:hypothetical protein